jgi:hypothetical protein
MSEDDEPRPEPDLRERLEAALKRPPRSPREFTERAAREAALEREPEDDEQQ